MTMPAIKIEGLWKEYTLGPRTTAGMTLRESIVESVKAPLRRLKGNGKGASNESFWALRDLSFEIGQGEVVGIIGRNGAGKSTLLKILSRITAPTKGRVEIRGRVASLLEVGTGFHQELTGRENIRLNGAVLGMSSREIKSKFDEIVAFSGVEKFLDTPVKRYSSGMQVRLAFAVAAHLDPEILIVDEVLAVGDAEFQKKCLGKMSEVASGGRTVLFVSHQLGMVARLCTRGILMSGGSVSFSGTSKAAIDQYMAQTRSGAHSKSDRARLDVHRENAITEVEVYASNGEAADQIPWDKPFLVRVELAVRPEIGGMLLGIAIDSMRGGRVTTWVARLAEHFQDGSEANEIWLEVVPELVAPGNYSLTIALTESDLTILHLRESEWPFTVIDTGSRMAEFDHIDYGVATIPARWQNHKPVAVSND